MSFKLARWVTTLLLFLAGASFSAAAYAGRSTLQTILLLLGAAEVIAWFGTGILWCRCPHCGRRVTRGVLLASVCPGCGGNLLTGEIIRLKLK